MDKELVENFLRELLQLMSKYHVYVGGCGCIGSPYGDIGEYEFENFGGSPQGVELTLCTKDGKETIRVTE